MTFPTETNGLASVTSGQSLAAGGHAARHNELKAAIESIRDVLGGGSLTPGTGINVTSAGNVGIGTSSPANALHVSTSSSTPLRLQSTTNLASIFMVDPVGGIFLTNDQSAFRVITGTDTAGSGGTERMRIDNAGLITGSGTSLGAWTAYTPTLGGFTLGNGTITGFYCQIGKVVFFRARLLFGSTTTAASSNIAFSLPVEAKTGTVSTLGGTFTGGVWDASASTPYMTGAYLSATDTAVLRIIGASGALSLFTTTTPFTWTTSDAAFISGAYEAA
jgi:hypothetical protein